MANIILFVIVMFIAICIIAPRNKVVIPFKQSMDICSIPVVAFKNEDTQLNFLIDTGSTDSHVSESASKLIFGTTIESSTYSIAGGGDMNSDKVIDTVLSYSNNNYQQRLHVSSSLDDSFIAIKDKYGITIHGILGVDFLNKYNYRIDFKSLEITVKK